LSRQSKNLKLFETGKIFIAGDGDVQPEEIEMLAGLWTGDRAELEWHTKPEPCDFYDLKGAAESLLEGLHIGAARFMQLPDGLCAYTQTGISAQIPQVLAAYELRQKAFIFEMEISRLLRHIPDSRKSNPLPKFPSVSRDATLILAKETEADALLSHIRQMDEPLVEEVRLFDVFTGRPVAEGRKSVSVRIVYRSADATLEDAAVNEIHKRISQRLVKTFDAELPG